MPKLNITEREDAGRVILDLSGDIVFGEANTVFRQCVRNCLREGRTNIILDFARAGHLDSSGIGEMISALTAINREGGQLSLMNLSERILWLLQISKLTEIFVILSDEEQRAAGRN